MLRLCSALVLALLAAGLALETPLAGQQPPVSRRPSGLERVNGRNAAAREVIVRMRQSPVARALADTLDVDVNEAVGGGLRRLRSRRHSTSELLARLRGQGDVLYAEPNYQVQAAAAPNDPYLPMQWALRQPVAGAGIDATSAWTITTGSRRFVVGVVDTGVDYTHPDLRDNIWTAPASFTVNIGGVNVTCAAGSHGFDAITMSCDPSDSNGHGTRMAGVIGGVGNNGIGVSGVNWSTSIMPLKFMNETAKGWNSDAIKAMEFAIQVRNTFAATHAADVRILSNSWGGAGYSIALEDQVIRAGEHDMLVVASAGNDGRNTDLSPFYPASFELANVLSVAATDEDDRLESYSNFGALTVDIAAPGHDIVSTQLRRDATDSGYSTGDGTSPAGAFAAGGAALLLSHCAMDTTALRDTILNSVDVIPGLAGKTESSGRLNIGRALRSCAAGNAAPSLSFVSPVADQRFTAPASVGIEVSAFDSDGTVARVDFYIGTTLIATDTAAPFRTTWTTSNTGTYRVRAVATDNDGATTETTTPRTFVVDSAIVLSAPWQTGDIGAVGAAGTTVPQGGGFVVQGAGADIWGTADAFRFVYQALNGDGRITARVADIQAVDAWTKAGVMIRATLQPGSAHALMVASPGKGFAFQRRPASGGTSVHTSGGPGTAPAWVRLERRGQVVTASLSRDGITWSTVGDATIALGATAYVGVAVSSHRTGVLAAATFESVDIALPPPVPAGWNAGDIGAVGAAGSAVGTAAGAFTVRGAGADVWGAADAFHFVHRTLTGDGEIVAHVASVQNVNAWTKAGVMIRQSLRPGSPHAFLMVTPGKGIAFQRRVVADGPSVHTSGGAGTAPRWLRLVRTGQVITASQSVNGTTWTLVDTQTLAASGPVYIGLAVSSHDPARTATVGFTNVQVR